jgi:hypothetical protein
LFDSTEAHQQVSPPWRAFCYPCLPFVLLGGGIPFFAGSRPPVHLVASDSIADDLIQLTYIPANRARVA